MKTPKDVFRILKDKAAKNTASWFGGSGTWPLVINLDPPTEKEVRQEPGALRHWAMSWFESADLGTVAWEKRQWRGLGEQLIPVALEFKSPFEVIEIVGEETNWKRAESNWQVFNDAWPEKLDKAWGGKRYQYLSLLSAEETTLMRDLLLWVQDNPKSNCYMRELPFDGIDSKWIETRVKPIMAIGMDIGIRGETTRDIEEFLGLRRKPHRVRIRIVCPELRSKMFGLDDLECPVLELSKLPIQPSRVLIIENQATGLAVPDLQDTVVVFQMGLSVSAIEKIPFVLKAVEVIYWGDVDTYGLIALASARRVRRDIQSVMMDKTTWKSHLSKRVAEPKVASLNERELLDSHEQEMWDMLIEQHGREKATTRLEQEKIPWQYALEQLHKFFVRNPLSSTD
jgi:hypothetical protein